MTELQELTERLDAMRGEHRALDAEIAALVAVAARDEVSIARLKKRKLRLKDEMTVLEDRLLPDIIA